MVPTMVPSRVSGGLPNSSSNSGIFFQVEGQVQGATNSHMSSSFATGSSLVPVSGDLNNGTLNSVPTSGPSVGASSLVTDANSALSHLQRSASFNTDPYMRVPASPLSFSSNNISISGSSGLDGSCVVQQSSQQDQWSHQKGASSATSQIGQISLPNGSFVQQPNYLSQMQKSPHLDIKHEDLLQQQAIQQLLQRDNPQFQGLDGHSPQFQALVQQQRFRQQQQQQFLQSMPQIQRAQLQQQQFHLRHQLQQQQQGVQHMPSMKRPSDVGVCARRLMQYLYHQRQRPSDNSIAYWRKFVAEYYSPRARKRWCLSLYENVGQHALGVFPQSAMDAWQCDLCKSKSGRGFEATFEVLPRLNEIKFSSGIIDELLYLDFPHEFRSPTGIMILEYKKAVQESVYEQLRVIREGQLRIAFTPDLKILYWEFCARRHEELLPRRSVAPQVNRLLQAAQKCQSTISESGADGVSQQDLQSNSNMVLAAGHQLAKSLEFQSLNDLGFSKRYVRCLQISEVVSSMKDLVDFCKEHKAGPIEGLKNYPRHVSAVKQLQMQKIQAMEQMANTQGLPMDQNTLNKILAMHPGLMVNNNPQMVGRKYLGGSKHASLGMNNYSKLLMQQDSINSFQPELATSSMSNSHQSPSSYQGQPTNITQGGSFPNLPPGGFSNHQPQQHMIQQILQEMNSTKKLVDRPSVFGFGNNASEPSGLSPSVVPAPRGNNSFTAVLNESVPVLANNGFDQKSQDLSDELFRDIANEFSDNGFFNEDLDEGMGYDWK